MAKVKSKQAGIKVKRNNPAFEFTFNSTMDEQEVPEEYLKYFNTTMFDFKKAKKKKKGD